MGLRYQWAPYIHLGPCHVVGPLYGWFCQLPTGWLGCLGLRFAGPTHPPTTTLPSPLPPTHPLIHDTRDITETFQKTFTKPVILTSCQLVYIYNVSYNTSLLLEQVWRGYNQAPQKYSALNIEIIISRNTKCAIWNGFPRSSHKLSINYSKSGHIYT